LKSGFFAGNQAPLSSRLSQRTPRTFTRRIMPLTIPSARLRARCDWKANERAFACTLQRASYATWCAHTSSRSDRQHLPSRCIAIIDLNGSPRPALRGLSTGLARRPPELERDQALDEVRLAVGVSLPVCAVA